MLKSGNVEIDPRGSSSISVIQRQHSCAHQFWAGATVHCSLQHFEAVNLPFGLSVAPRELDCIFDGINIPAQNAAKRMIAVSSVIANNCPDNLPSVSNANACLLPGTLSGSRQSAPGPKLAFAVVARLAASRPITVQTRTGNSKSRRTSYSYLIVRRKFKSCRGAKYRRIDLFIFHNQSDDDYGHH
nr:hypothetical protein [Phyllobacterium endophyticum]